jgi:hypothetical protein
MSAIAFRHLHSKPDGTGAGSIDFTTLNQGLCPNVTVTFSAAGTQTENLIQFVSTGVSPLSSGVEGIVIQGQMTKQ